MSSSPSGFHPYAPVHNTIPSYFRPLATGFTCLSMGALMTNVKCLQTSNTVAPMLQAVGSGVPQNSTPTRASVDFTPAVSGTIRSRPEVKDLGKTTGMASFLERGATLGFPTETPALAPDVEAKIMQATSVLYRTEDDKIVAYVPSADERDKAIELARSQAIRARTPSIIADEARARERRNSARAASLQQVQDMRIAAYVSANVPYPIALELANRPGQAMQIDEARRLYDPTTIDYKKWAKVLGLSVTAEAMAMVPSYYLLPHTTTDTPKDIGYGLVQPVISAALYTGLSKMASIPHSALFAFFMQFGASYATNMDYSLGA